MSSKELPKRRVQAKIAESRLFEVAGVDLEFSNGVSRRFEILQTKTRGAVMIAPILDGQLLLVREYAAGVHEYVLGFAKGIIDPGETIVDAALREMQEEVGYGARDIQELDVMSVAPGYIASRIHLVVARDLYPAKLEGDEPEPLEVVAWPLNALEDLVARDDFHDARCIAGVYMLRDLLTQEKL